jgi:hypothetical protein
MAGIDGVGRVGIRSYVAPVSLSSIVTNGLVLSLDASNPLSYSGSGTTWTDLTGNGNNGTLTNGTSYSSANGGTLTFDGINDYVDTNLVTNQSAFTYCIWGKSSASGYPNRIMGNADSTGGANGVNIMWGVPSSNKIWTVRRATGVGSFDFITNDITNFTGNWHYIVLTYDSVNGSKLYCDNVLVGSNTGIGFTSTLKLRIGKDGNGTDAFNGSVGAVQVYNKALSSTEVEQNFNATKSRFGFVSYTTRTAAFAAATGITDATILNALNTFDTGLISNGLASKMKALYPFVGGTSTTHKFNFMDARDVDAAFRLQFNGGWVHSSGGIQGNGVNTYSDTYFKPSNNFSNHHLGGENIYSRTNISETSFDIAATGLAAGGNFNLTSRHSGAGGVMSFQTGAPYINVVVSDSLGLSSGNSIATNDRRIYKNGVKIGTDTVSNSELGTAKNIYIGAVNYSTLFSSTRQYAFSSITEGMTDIDQTTLYTLVQALQTSLSRAV